MIRPRFDADPDDPYWDRTGVRFGKKVWGHTLTEDELEEFNRTLYCFVTKWIVEKGILWRWDEDEVREYHEAKALNSE